MRNRLHAVFLFLVLAPLAAMGYLGYRLISYQAEREERRYSEALEQRLGEVARTIDSFMQERNRSVLENLWATGGQTELLRQARRDNPAIAETFRVEPDGRITHPSRAEHLTIEEWAFLEQAAQILKLGPLDLSQQQAPPKVTTQQAIMNAPFAPQQESFQGARQQRQYTLNVFNPDLSESGWILWFYGPGLQVLTWTRSESGAVTGAILDRSRLLADLIGRLPDSEVESSMPGASLTALVDTQGEVLYQWGRYTPPEDSAPAAQLALRPPLQSWSLRLYEPTANGARSRSVRAYSFAILLLSLTGVIVVMAVYFIRENGRQLREAAQRVSFVNQVSHELKTPLTNIRMYAELLEDHLGEEEEREKRHARIITEESHRLSRLIHNILSFSREQRGQLYVSPSPGIVDETVDCVVERFRPALEAQDIAIETNFDASGWVRFDRDAVEQILCNLISNVEKYGASGRSIAISTEQSKGLTTLRVCDRGPGIPEKMREAIFEPFHRLSDKINEGASGTGIGLSISRELARLHGGDLRVEPRPQGACFCATLATPTAESRKGETT